MTTNMGTFDRIARVVVAAILVTLAFTTGFAGSGVLHWLALAVAAIFVLTAIVGNCPLYGILGIKTCSTR